MDEPFRWEPIGADGVMKCRMSDGVIVTLDLAEALIGEFTGLTGGTRAPVLVDMRRVRSTTRDARGFLGGATQNVSALGLLAGSPATRMVANFFIGLNRTNVPTRMFTDEAAAVSWLRSYVA